MDTKIVTFSCKMKEAFLHMRAYASEVLQCQHSKPNQFHGYYSAFGMINVKGIFTENPNQKEHL